MSFSNHIPKPRMFTIIGIVLTTCFLLLPTSTVSSTPQPSGRWPPNYIPTSKRDARIANATLGFGAIFALGLPDRTDKRDMMELSAALTGITLTWVDGVQGNTMNPKAVPPVHDDPNETSMRKDAELGRWRGHMNVLRKIIKENISSALILEDDSDWDIRLPLQMQQFAAATRDVLSKRPSPPPTAARPRTASPYGEDWDIFWMGHCGGWPPASDEPYSVIRGDPTVPPAFDIQALVRDLDVGQTDCAAHFGTAPHAACAKPRLAADERIVQENGSPVCAVGYAVSQHGARKMMARIGGLSLLDVDAQIDTEMTEMCRASSHPLGAGGPDAVRCLIPTPPYISSHFPRGLVRSDSDIADSNGSDNSRRTLGASRGMQWSVRLNAANLIDGEEPESQYVHDKKDDFAKNHGNWRYRRLEEYRNYVPQNNETEPPKNETMDASTEKKDPPKDVKKD